MLPRVALLALWVLCLAADVVTLVWMLFAIIAGSNRALHIAFAKDQSMNTAIGGHWDETISSRAWRNRNNSRRWRVARRVIDALFFMDKNHCQKSYETEKIEARDWLDEVSE